MAAVDEDRLEVRRLLRAGHPGRIASLVPPDTLRSDRGLLLNGYAMRYGDDPAYRQGAFTNPDPAVRRKAIDHIRRISIEDSEELGRMEFEETRIGRVADLFGLRLIRRASPGRRSYSSPRRGLDGRGA